MKNWTSDEWNDAVLLVMLIVALVLAGVLA